MTARASHPSCPVVAARTNQTPEAPCGSLAAASFPSTGVAWPRARTAGTGPHGALRGVRVGPQCSYTETRMAHHRGGKRGHDR